MFVKLFLQSEKIMELGDGSGAHTLPDILEHEHCTNKQHLYFLYLQGQAKENLKH